MREKRLEWIDWMKALGIYLIVLGHFYSIGEKFIYVFHVPLFFVISGFLNKKEADGQVFWKKLWYNLAVPMLIMAILNLIIHSILKLLNGTFEPTDLYWFVRNVLRLLNRTQNSSAASTPRSKTSRCLENSSSCRPHIMS